MCLLPSSRGNVRSHTVPVNTRSGSDGKRPAVILFSKSVHPLPLLVYAGAERGCTGARAAVEVQECCRGTPRERPWVRSKIVRCTHKLTTVSFQSPNMSLKHVRFARESYRSILLYFRVCVYFLLNVGIDLILSHIHGCPADTWSPGQENIRGTSTASFQREQDEKINKKKRTTTERIKACVRATSDTVTLKSVNFGLQQVAGPRVVRLGERKQIDKKTKQKNDMTCAEPQMQIGVRHASEQTGSLVTLTL